MHIQFRVSNFDFQLSTEGDCCLPPKRFTYVFFSQSRLEDALVWFENCGLPPHTSQELFRAIS